LRFASVPVAIASAARTSVLLYVVNLSKVYLASFAGSVAA